MHRAEPGMEYNFLKFIRNFELTKNAKQVLWLGYRPIKERDNGR